LYNIVDSNKYTLNIQKLINKLASILQKEDDTMFDTISHICYKTYLYYLNIIYKLEPKIKLAQQAKVEFGKYKLIKHGIDEKIKEKLETVKFKSTFQNLYKTRPPLDTEYLNKEHSIELAIFKLFNIDECILFNDDERNMNYYDILEIYRYMNCLYIDKISKLRKNKDNEFDTKIAISFIIKDDGYLKSLCDLIDRFNISSLDYNYINPPQRIFANIPPTRPINTLINMFIEAFNAKNNFYKYLTNVEKILEKEFMMNLTNYQTELICYKIIIYYNKYILDYHLKYFLQQFIQLYIKTPYTQPKWDKLYNAITTNFNLKKLDKFIQYIKDCKEQSFQNKLAILLSSDKMTEYTTILKEININIVYEQVTNFDKLEIVKHKKPADTTPTLGGNGQLNNDKLQLLLSYIFKHIKTIEC